MPANFNLSIAAESASAVSTSTDDFTMLRAGVVFDAFARADGAAAGTCAVQKGATAITNGLNVNAAVNTIARASTIDAAVNTLAVGDTLRFAKSAAVATSTVVYIAAAGVTN